MSRKNATRVRVATVLCFAAALVTLATLAQTAAAAGKQARATTSIRVLTTAGREVVWQAWKANFERANPDIEVNLSFLTTQAYPQTLLTQLQAGSGPDLMFGQGGSGQIHSILNLAGSNRLADLSAQPWVKRIPAAAKPLFQRSKKFYALPLAFVPTGVAYNTDMFSQYGLKVPTSFQQLLGLCTSLKSHGKVPFVFAGSSFNSGDLGQMIAASTVYGPNPQWNTQRSQGKTTFAGTPAWRTVLQQISDMNSTGCFGPQVPGLSIPGVFGLLGSGQAAMWSGPSAALAPIRGVAPSLNLALFPFPGKTAVGTRAEAGYTDSIGVNAASPNKAAAIKFLNFIAREGQSRVYTKFNSAISVHDANVANSARIPAPVKSFVPFLQAKKYMLYPNSTWPNADVFAAFSAGITGILTGQTTNLDAVLQAMDTAWNKGPA